MHSSLRFWPINVCKIKFVYDAFVFQLWDLEANKKKADCSGHLSWVQRVQFSPDGSQLLSCSDDQTIRVKLQFLINVQMKKRRFCSDR